MFPYLIFYNIDSSVYIFKTVKCILVIEWIQGDFFTFFPHWLKQTICQNIISSSGALVTLREIMLIPKLFNTSITYDTYYTYYTNTLSFNNVLNMQGSSTLTYLM